MTSRSQWLKLATVALGAGAVLALACAGQRGATEQQMAQAKAFSPEGAEIFDQSCAECHGPKGEGGPGTPTIMGGSALPVKVKEKKQKSNLATDEVARDRAQRDQVPGGGKELRMRFNTAADIFKFVTEEHPTLPTALEEGQWWAALTFVLKAHGLKVPEGGLTPENAASVKNE